MDNESTTELIKQIGAIIVALVGVVGTIATAIINARSSRQIQELILRTRIIEATPPESRNEALRQELDSLSAKKQDISRKKQKTVFYVLLPSVLLLISGLIFVTSIHKPSLTLTPTPTHTPTLTLTPTPIPCVCQSATDDNTLRCLILTESEAANNDDLTLIRQIFAPDATIFRGDTEEEWDSPMAYYIPAFASLDFTEATHFNIHRIEITAQVARYTSGSSGYYAEPGTTPTPYYNENPSEHWGFNRNDRGCWVITRFEFNASLIDFP